MPSVPCLGYLPAGSCCHRGRDSVGALLSLPGLSITVGQHDEYGTAQCSYHLSCSFTQHPGRVYRL